MSKKLSLLFISAAIFIGVFGFNSAFAATLYWVGNSGANTSVATNWKTTNPTTCGSGDASAAPSIADTAVFDPDCDNGANIDSSFSVTGIDMQSGYAGNVTASSTVIVSGSMTVTAGTLQGAGNITVNGGGVTGNGAISMTGGTFLVDGAGSFGGATDWSFYDLSFGNGSGTTTTTATGAGIITVSHNMTVATGQTLEAAGKTWNLNGTGSSSSIAYVRASTQASVGSGATADTSFSSLPAVGNHIIVTATIWNDPQPASVVFSDNQGNSYTTDITKADDLAGTSGAIVAIGSAKVATSSGTFTVTATPNTTSGNAFEVIAVEYSGLVGTSWADKTGSNKWSAAANAATVTATLATSQPDELIVAATGLDGSDTNVNVTTPTTGYTQRGVNQDEVATNGFESADKIVSATETSSAAWNHDSSRGAAVIATYKGANSGALTVMARLRQALPLLILKEPGQQLFRP